jgi:hypothetical protein
MCVISIHRIEKGAIMPDDLSKRRPQDASRINIHEAWELEYWCRYLGVTPAQLRLAVKEVGVMVTNVRRHLGK